MNITTSKKYLLFFSFILQFTFIGQTYSQCPDIATCSADQVVAIDLDSDVSLCSVAGTNIAGDFSADECVDAAGLFCTAYVFQRSPQSGVTSIGGEIGQGNGCNGQMDDVFLQYQDPTTNTLICEDILDVAGSQLNLGLLFPADIDDDGNWLVTEIIVFMCANSNAFPTLCGACANDPTDCTGCDTGDEIVRPCDDGDPCTENDMLTIDNCGLECIPCAGTPIPGCGGTPCIVDAPVITVTDNTCEPEADGFYTTTTDCAAGFAIEFSTDGGTTWSADRPTYPDPFITRCMEESCSEGNISGLDASNDAVFEVNNGTVMIGSATLSIVQTFNGTSTLDENEISSSQTTGDLAISSGVSHTCIENSCGLIDNSMNNLYNFSEPVCEMTIDLWDLDRDDEMVLSASGPNGPVSYTINTIGAGIDNTGNTFTSNDPSSNYPRDGAATLGMFSVTFDDCITQISIDYYDASNTSGDGGSYSIVFQTGCTNEECFSDVVTIMPSPMDCTACVASDPIINVTDNTCDPDLEGFYSIQTPCGDGFVLEFSIDNGATWSTAALDYPAEFIARCINIDDASCVSNEVPVTTNPAACCVSDPVAILMPAGPACSGATVSFDASGSTGAITAYDWDFDGDGVIDATTAVPTTSFTYPAIGTYTAFVTTVDGSGLCPSSSTSIEVTICDTNAVVCPPSSVTIVDGDPSDPAALGEPQVTTSACNPTFQITNVDVSAMGTCPLEEVITRTFTITDNCGQSECVQTINVEVDNPASINALPVTPEICLGDDITLDASASVGDGLSYCWNVGLGTVGCDYTTAVASHQYAAAGTYDITLSITDQYGCTDDQNIGTVTVYMGPEAVATAAFDPCTLVVTYDASTSVDNQGPDDLIYTWDFGDGSTSGTAAGTYTFENCTTVGPISLSVVDPSVPFPACNSDQLAFTFSTDTEPPVLVCPAPTELNCGDPLPLYTDLSEFLAAGGTATDNCAVLEFNQVSLDTIPGICPYVYTIEVVYEALDLCDNRSTCTQVFNLLPDLPSATVPGDVILSCGDDTSTDATGFPMVNQTDCMRPATVAVDDEIISGSCPGDATIIRTFTITDDCGNTQTYIQNINIVNDIKPTLEGPPDVTIGCLDACDPDGTGGIAVVVDFCMPIDGSANPVTLSYSDEYVGFVGSPLAGGIVGQIIRTFVAVDACGNEGIYVQTISVIGDNSIMTCNDRVNISLAQGCEGITPDFLLEAPTDTKYFLSLHDGQFGFAPSPNATFDSIDWSVYIESGQPVTYTITDFCGNSCWGEVLIEANVIPQFESPCTYEPGFKLNGSGEINDEDELFLNDMIGINEDPGRTTDYLGRINLTDGSCQEAFLVGHSDFIYNAAPHGKELDIIYVDINIFLVNTEDGSQLSFSFPTGTIDIEALTALALNPGEYDVFVSASDHRAFGDYSLYLEVTGCLPTCTTICGSSYPEEFLTIEEIMDTLAVECYSPLIGDIIVREEHSGDMCDGILHVVTYTGQFLLHGELVKQDLVTQAYLEEPIDLGITDIIAPRHVDLDCGADITPEAILAETGSGTQAYPFYLDTEQIKIDTICLEEILVHYEVPIDTVEEVVAIDGLWVLIDIVKKERRDSLRCLRRGPNPDIQFQEILLDDNRCNIIVDYSDFEIEACAGGKKIIRDWSIIDWCDNSAQLLLSQTIEVKDLEAPTIAKLDDVMISIDPWTCSGKLRLPIGDHDDNCNTELLTESWQLSEGQVVDGYAIDLWLENNPIEAILTVKDDCGNTALDTINIIVEDKVAPVAICNEELIVSLTSGMLGVNAGAAKVFAESIDAGSHDAGCGEVSLHVRRATGCCSTDCIDQYECTATDPKTGICIDSTVIGYTTVFADYVKFCCEDVGDTVMVELRITDQAGNYNICTVGVAVIDKTQRILSCPEITVSCLDDMNAISNPTITGQFCDSEDGEAPVLINETDVNGYCGAEQLIREWYIDRDQDGSFSAGDPFCKQIVTLESVDGGMNPYTIKWPKHYTGEIIVGKNLECDAEGELDSVAGVDIKMGDPQICSVDNSTGFGEPVWCEAACSLIAHSMETDTIYASDACLKLINRWTIIDWCKWDANGANADDDNDSSRDQFEAIEDWAQGACAACPDQGPNQEEAVYFKYLTVEEDGYYTFDQVIKVVDDSAPEISVMDAYQVNTTGGAISKDDATACRGSEDLTATVTDFCNGIESPAQLVKWNVTVQRGDFTIDIQTGTGRSMIVNSGEGTPGDVHIITWTATDGCGNVTEASTEVTFGDEVNPVPFCISAVSTSIGPGQDSVVVWASDVDFGSYDNCTDYSDLQWALLPEGQTPIAPGTDGFADQFGLAINCAGGRSAVSADLWIWDASGNADFCNTTILAEGSCSEQENEEEMGSSSLTIAGQLQTELGDAISNVTIELNSFLPEYPKSKMTNDSGEYSFENNPTGYNYALAPDKDTDHANGVSTLDLLLIQRHILALDILDSPYKIIAADISNDNAVTTQDIVEARRLILGVTDRFSDSRSWRFVDGDFNFVSTIDPWPYSDTRNMINMERDALSENFIGLKVGDVNENAAANAAMRTETRYESTLELTVSISDQNAHVLHITSSDAQEIYGMQFSVAGIDNEVVRISSESMNIAKQHYHTAQAQTNVSWHTESGEALAGAMTLDIEFKHELTAEQISRLTLRSAKTPAEAYVGSSLEVWDLSIEIESDLNDQPTVSQNWPNPFSKTSQIAVYLPEATDQLTLRIYNPMGQLVLSESGSYPAGTHLLTLDAKTLGAAGIYHYTIQTEAFMATKQMLLME